MKKLSLSLDELKVESFRTVDDPHSLRGTVKANSGCQYTTDPYQDCGNYTEYWSTCAASGDTCDGCLSGTGGCIALYTYEESYCVCTNEYSCECAFSEASNCHRCTGP
ncbi:MAG TPA: hypothetical protein VF771_12875 [Longimicrobiaceae bacterium]